MQIDLPVETWKKVYDLASLGCVELGEDTEAFTAFEAALLAQPEIDQLEYGWNDEVRRASS